MLTFTLPPPRVLPNDAQREASLPATASCRWACSLAKGRAALGASLEGTLGDATGLGAAAATGSFAGSAAGLPPAGVAGSTPGCSLSATLRVGSAEVGRSQDGSSVPSVRAGLGGALRLGRPTCWVAGLDGPGACTRCRAGCDGRGGKEVAGVGAGFGTSELTKLGAGLFSLSGSALFVGPMEEGRLGGGLTLGAGFDSRAVLSTRLGCSGASARAAT